MTSYNDNFYLYGGKGSSVFGDLATYCTTEHEWSSITPLNQNPPPTRFGHSLNGYNQKLYIFGGRLDFKVITPTNELLIFNLATNFFEPVKQFENPPKPRFYHASCMIGRFLIVSGGLDKFGQPMNDLLGLDLVKMEWVNFRKTLQAFRHSCTPVFEPERKLELLAAQMRFVEDESFKSQIKEEGVYFFYSKLHILSFSMGKA
jgi:hypothetical protein